MLLLAILVASPAHTEDAIGMKRFGGGPLDGIGIVLVGSSAVPAKPSLPDASPVPKAMAGPVAKVVAALSTSDEKTLRSMMANPADEAFCLNPHGQPCDVAIQFSDVDFRTHCRINSPYYLASFDRSVRLEWICDDQLTYISWLTLSDGKIAGLSQMSKRPMPVVVPQSSAPTHG